MKIFGYQIPPDYREQARRAEEGEHLRQQRKEKKKRAKIKKYQEIYYILNEYKAPENECVSDWTDFIGLVGNYMGLFGSLYQGVVAPITILAWFFIPFTLGVWPLLGAPFMFVGFVVAYWAMLRAKSETSKNGYLALKYEMIEYSWPVIGLCVVISMLSIFLVIGSNAKKGWPLDVLENSSFFIFFLIVIGIIASCMLAYSLTWSEKVRKYGNTGRASGNR